MLLEISLKNLLLAPWTVAVLRVVFFCPTCGFLQHCSGPSLSATGNERKTMCFQGRSPGSMKECPTYTNGPILPSNDHLWSLHGSVFKLIKQEL